MRVVTSCFAVVSVGLTDAVPGSAGGVGAMAAALSTLLPYPALSLWEWAAGMAAIQEWILPFILLPLTPVSGCLSHTNWMVVGEARVQLPCF